jgi:hypothetical protein
MINNEDESKDDAIDEESIIIFIPFETTDDTPFANCFIPRLKISFMDELFVPFAWNCSRHERKQNPMQTNATESSPMLVM